MLPARSGAIARRCAAAVALSLLALPGSAEACRVYRPPAQKIVDGYRLGAISSVALVRITAADFIGPEDRDVHPWRASARIERVVRGNNPVRTLSFERGYGSSACQEPYPLPRRGEVWVLYFWSANPGRQAVWASYPLSVASQADPALR